jgi:uncharacterized protein (UPF0147 family)
MEEGLAAERDSITRMLEDKIDHAKDKLKMVIHVLDDAALSPNMAVGAMAIVWETFDLLGSLGFALRQR